MKSTSLSYPFSAAIDRLFTCLRLLFSAILLIACSPSQELDVAWGNRASVLLIGNGDEPQSLDPQMAVGSNDFNIITALFEGLTDLHPETLDVVPGVAESWKVSRDGMRYSFYLRNDAKWSNGEPVTSKDFLFAWERALNPKTASSNAPLFFSIKNAEAYNTGVLTEFSDVGVRALPSRLEVTLESPISYFLAQLSHPVFFPLYKDVIDQHSDDWTRPGNLIGNGAFTLKEWKLNKWVSVKANPHYWDKQNVHLNGIMFFPIEDRFSEERAFRAGNIHLTCTPQMAIEKIQEYQRTNPELLQQTPVYASYYYDINTARKPFNDARVRRALAMAINRKQLVEKVTRGGEIPAGTFVPADPHIFQARHRLRFDPENARKLLTEAGYPNGENFPVFELLINNGEIHRKVATAIQQMWWQHLHIKVELRNMEWKTFINAQNNKDYTISRAGWIADFVHPNTFFETLLSNSSNNDTNWSHSGYDTLVNLARRSSSDAQASELLEKANRILVSEVPVIPLFYPSDNNLVQRSVKGWYPNLLHRHPYKGVYLSSDD